MVKKTKKFFPSSSQSIGYELQNIGFYDFTKIIRIEVIQIDAGLNMQNNEFLLIVEAYE